jgi:hypothetical protein
MGFNLMTGYRAVNDQYNAHLFTLSTKELIKVGNFKKIVLRSDEVSEWSG